MLENGILGAFAQLDRTETLYVYAAKYPGSTLLVYSAIAKLSIPQNVVQCLCKQVLGAPSRWMWWGE